jgi:hypothetical protein
MTAGLILPNFVGESVTVSEPTRSSLSCSTGSSDAGDSPVEKLQILLFVAIEYHVY